MSTRRIRSCGDLDAMQGQVDHVLTLFSGGLDSSDVLEELSQRKLRITALSVDAELLREKGALEQLWTREAVEGRYMGDGGTYRLRRYGAFDSRPGSVCQQLPHGPYEQPKYINSQDVLVIASTKVLA
ncbi:hypothetical protein RD110_10475 [Rhodoferax koreense]|uniref:Argininosuccinate synthase n=1 Tax=Rhodoferax koreensis TaxID=1842727 RepID=A0A1P8JUZ4_9BURK|nr:2OG-Fe dioxygenase family protein [Rhodoferax koreense]APW37558.1 hypothetical protein RD110_10475 [Rhodoferax koreense]